MFYHINSLRSNSSIWKCRVIVEFIKKLTEFEEAMEKTVECIVEEFCLAEHDIQSD